MLQRIKSNDVHTDIYFCIHHYTGRLTAWERGANFVVNHAMRFGDVLNAAQVIPVEPDSFPRRCIRAEQDPEILLRRVLPHSDRDQIQALADDIRANKRGLLERWAKKKKPHEPQVHAEINIAHHFYFKDLAFAFGDRYIGCSKPPCYCCHLLLDRHPGQFTMRQTSKNAWLSWSPGIPFVEIQEGGADNSGLQDDRLVAAVRGVSQRLHQDIVEALSRQQTLRGNKFDSTNGETLSVLVRR